MYYVIKTTVRNENETDVFFALAGEHQYAMISGQKLYPQVSYEVILETDDLDEAAATALELEGEV